MKKFAIILTLPIMIFSTQLWAGGSGNHSHGDGHSHSHGPVTQEAAINKAKAKVSALVKSGKLDASWSSVQAFKATKKDFGKGMEWVVSLHNPQISDAKQQTLYVFFTLNGRYLATNYTGQ